MSADPLTPPSFRCPVCRASQTLRDTCRRCQADLRLVVSAYRRLAYVTRLREAAAVRGDHAREQSLAQEQRWLAPSTLLDSSPRQSPPRPPPASD